MGLKASKISNLGNAQWNPQKDQFKAEEIKRCTDTLEGMGHLERQCRTQTVTERSASGACRAMHVRSVTAKVGERLQHAA